MRTELLLVGVLALSACKKEEAVAPKPLPMPVPSKVEAPPSDEKPYNVALDFNPPLRVGAEAIATITITAREGFHVNPDYPLSFKPVANEMFGVTGERMPLTSTEKTPCKEKADDNCEVKVPLKLTPKTAGVASFEGVLSFSVCSEEKCLTPKETLTLRADVVQ
jgi:hypothetical protein